jgi:carbamoyltransferase
MAKKILSIHYGHNATIALSIDGKIVCVVSEERFNRIKNAIGFPYRAVEYVRDKYLDGDVNNVDAVSIIDQTLSSYNYLNSFGFEPHTYLDYFCYSRKSDIEKCVSTPPETKPVNPPELPTDETRKEAVRILAGHIGVDEKKISFSGTHHLAHCASCLYFLEPENKYLVFTLDGVGDGLCATVNICENGKIDTISKTEKDNSLAFLYCMITAYLGMKPNEHEFKVMGMAPYADPKQRDRIYEILKKALWLDENNNFTSDLSRDFMPFLIRNLIYERFDNVCAGMQKLAEELVCQWIFSWIEKTGIHSIAVSGGLFMNVKASKKVSEMSNVQKFFVMPSAADESLVFGGCYLENIKNGVKNPPAVTDLYLGREFSDVEIEEYFKNSNIYERYKVEKYSPDEMSKKVAEKLADNQIVARFCGREEWGARALGNRSILCNPSNRKNINTLNQAIKNRDFWMPFAPSILEEDLELYAKNPKNISTPYMCLALDSTDKAYEDIPAAMHPRDRTVRPQAVSRIYNPGYYNIIKEFKKLTGISGVLNTSFNLHGEPIVGSPADAIHTLDDSALKYLVLGNYFVEKK